MKVIFAKLTGGCMRPLLKSGEICVIFPTKKVFPGDVVLYQYCGQMFLHRVIKVFKDDIIVADDCNICGPIRIPQNCVLGVHHSIFSGLLGYVYHIIVRHIFSIARRIKRIVVDP